MRGNWRVEIARWPPEELLTAVVRRELTSLLQELEETGEIAGSRPMKAYRWETVFSVRFNAGRWRLVYEVHKRSKFILVLSIGPRGQAYQGMKSGAWD